MERSVWLKKQRRLTEEQEDKIYHRPFTTKIGEPSPLLIRSFSINSWVCVHPMASF